LSAIPAKRVAQNLIFKAGDACQKDFVFELRCSETENDSLRWSLGPFKTPQRPFGALAHTAGASERLASEKTQMSANQRHPFENTGREIVERFGKDNCRMRCVWVRSGAAKHRANQQDIDLALVSGTRARRLGSTKHLGNITAPDKGHCRQDFASHPNQSGALPKEPDVSLGRVGHSGPLVPVHHRSHRIMAGLHKVASRLRSNAHR